MFRLSKVICGSSKYGPLIHRSLDNIGEFGEDVFMSINRDNKVYLAVADGVGSWRLDSIDPVQFPRSLMTEIKKIIDSGTSDKKSCSDMIQEAYAVLRHEHDNGKRHYGSSTFCFARIDINSGEIEIANIGDSAFAIIRNKNLFFNTKIAQQGFNFPYQIGLEMRGPQLYLDCKSDTQTYHQKLESGDKFILATDGVWDGMSFHMATHSMQKVKSLSEIGIDIWNEARERNPKKDDTTIILGEFLKD